MVRFWRLTALLCLLGLGACTAERSEKRALRDAEIQQYILAGKKHLSQFQGAQARDKFLAVYDNQKRFAGQFHCEAAYGVALADVQVVLAALNPPLLSLLEKQFGASSGHDLAVDPGAEIEAFWNTVTPTIRELIGYAEEITAVEGCAFAIGLDEVGVAPNELKFPLNFLSNEQPVVQVVFKSRFDVLEARFIIALAHAALGVADLLLAHDLRWEPDFAKFAHQLGVASDCIPLRGLVPCVFEDKAPEASPVHLLDWAFVFADNPRLLDESPERWAARSAAVAPALAAALQPLRDFTAALLARNKRLLEDAIPDERYREFAFIYYDANQNVEVDSADNLGVNVHDVLLRCEALAGTIIPETGLADCERRLASYEGLLDIGLMLIRTGPSPSSAVMGEVELLVERLYGALRSVSEPAYPYEKIPFSSLSRFFSELLPIIDAPAPNFLEADVSALFKSPRSIRAFLPAWQAGVGATGSRFLADGDDYEYFSPPPSTVTSVDAYLDQAYGGYLWEALGLEPKLAIEPDSATERPLFGCPGPHCIPADCLNAGNLYSELSGVPLADEETFVLHWPALYLWFPDPTFNGLLSVDLGVWTGHAGASPGNGSESLQGHLCPLTAGLQSPDNLTLQKSLWIFADFFVDHFQMAGLVFEFLDNL
jgi:hypothetical protein